MNARTGLLLIPLTVTCVVTTTAASEAPTLPEVVRRATAEFRNPQAAIEKGWLPMPACVSGPEKGAMGIHYVNGSILFDGALNPAQPEALVYEQREGRIRLVAAEFIVIAADWHATNTDPPVLLGQQFHLVPSPNRYGLPAFYELHVWAWKFNPHGTFADWNPHVTCDQFAPPQVM